MGAVRIDEELPAAPGERPGMAKPPADGVPMEHRFGRRFSCGTHVRLSAADGLEGEGRMLDVSLSGAFVETALDLPLFSTVSLFRTTPANRVIEMQASVVRRDATGVGVEWCETPPASICQVFGCPHPCREI